MNRCDLLERAPGQAEQIAQALSVISSSHPRMAKAIGSFWGFPECDTYLERIAVDGSDPLSPQQLQLSRELLSAIRTLQSIHVLDRAGA